jgi:ATP-dependent helicase HrpA
MSTPQTAAQGVAHDADLPAISYPPDLPVSARREEIARVIRDNQVVIVAGETGSGKTTQLPKICLELGRRAIGHTQPRRLAARTIAERIADELGVEVGGLVGYRVRFTDHAGPQTRVTVMTDGILLNQMHRDRLLRAYDTIIIDEAHERSLTIDFLLGYLKRILPERPDLKVIITSATIDPESFARHFTLDGRPAPIVEVSGRTFPVEIRYRPLVSGTQTSAESGDDPRGADADGDLNDAILASLAELAREKPGDVLVFLSGEAEIRDAADAIRDRLARDHDDRTEVLPLYGRLSAADQHRVFGRPAAGIRRRIVLATNVAETSLTVPGIRYVIDAGMARISRYSVRAKVQRLPVEPISQASATQRSGRSGRTSDGIAIRLYSAEDYDGRPAYTEPEILRTNLASVLLQMLSLGLGAVEEFPFLTPPDPRGIKDGLALLSELGAINRVGTITRTGRNLARLPIEPRFGRMVIEAERLGVSRPVRAIVAGLTVQDPRERPLERRAAADQAHARFTSRASDFLTLLNLWNYLQEKQKELSSSAFRRLCKAEFLNYLRVREWQDVEHQIGRLATSLRQGERGSRRPGEGRARGHPARPAARPQDSLPVSARASLDTAPEGVEAEDIHKALLSGLLSQIGLRDDRSTRPSTGRRDSRRPTARRPAHDYLGSRQTRFTLHPSSALAKKPPAAVMAAELVETSRLFGRINASIDPSWAEPLAGDLAKHTYAEPHWEKRQGAAVAYETVTVYGVPVVARRRVSYAHIDPVLARELFIRHALVEGDFTPHRGHAYDFLRANERLRRQLAQVEERTRRRDILYDDEAIVDFYKARLPKTATTVRDFEAWWRLAREADPDRLTMTAEDLAGDAEDEATIRDYPGIWRQADQTYTLDYHFEPGAEDDGVSVQIPLPLLGRVEPTGFDWQVAGLRRDLVQALLKSLPKALRRHVVPAADWAERILAELPATPPDGEPLTAAVAGCIRRMAGIVVDPADFTLERVPPHLRMTFCAVDERGTVIDSDKELVALQRRLSETTRRSVARATRPGRTGAAATDAATSTSHPVVERTGITAWDFGDVQRVVDTEFPAPSGGHNVVRAYPSLVLDGATVSLVFLSTPEERRQALPAAIRRLLVAGVASPASYVAEHLTAAEKLSLGASGYPTTAALFDDCLTAIADEVLHAGHPDGMIFTRAEFEATRDRLQAVVLDRMFEVASLTARIFTASRAARAALAKATALSWLAALTDMRTQLDQLVFPGFVSRTGLAALAQLPRYLAGVSHRLEALARDPGRDRVRMTEFEKAAALYAEAGGRIPSADDAEPRLRHVRWMLEEFRVSLFAQHLGTAEPVSLKRIRKTLAD